MPPAATSDDPALVAGCRAGEATSLEQFFVTHVHYVERVISRLTGPTPDLEDLVQTTFIQAFQSFGRYRGEASLKTWVTRIAVHTALHQLRSGVRRAVPLELVSDADEPSDPTEPPISRRPAGSSRAACTRCSIASRPRSASRSCSTRSRNIRSKRWRR